MGERELRIGDTDLILGPGPLVQVIETGTVSGDTAPLQVQAILDYADEMGERVCLLVDLNDAGRPPTAARRAFIKLAADVRVRRVALHGLHAVARAMAMFFLRWTDRTHVRFFAKEAEARAWLRRDDLNAEGAP